MNKQFVQSVIDTPNGIRKITVPLGDNRRARRAELRDTTPYERPVVNNRSNPKKRQRVFLKMAHFALSVGTQANGISIAEQKKSLNPNNNGNSHNHPNSRD